MACSLQTQRPDAWNEWLAAHEESFLFSLEMEMEEYRILACVFQSQYPTDLGGLL